MWGLRRSPWNAWRDNWFTAGYFLIIASLAITAKSQSNDSFTTLTSLENEATSLPTFENLTTVQPGGKSTETLPPTTAKAPVTTAAQPDVTSSHQEDDTDALSFRTDDTLTTNSDVTSNNYTGWFPGGDSGVDESKFAIEFIVVIIVTVLIILAVMIVVAALGFICCQRRAERPTRFVKFKKRKPKHKYDKMDVEMSTLPRKHEPTGGSWIFSANEVGDEESEPMDLNMRSTHITNHNYDPEKNGELEKAPSISDYHSEGPVPTLELEDDDNDLNVNPMYTNGQSNRGSGKDSGIHGNGSDVVGDGDMSVRSDNDLQSFADETVEL